MIKELIDLPSRVVSDIVIWEAPTMELNDELRIIFDDGTVLLVTGLNINIEKED